jgi:hypothetical protein
VSYHNLNPAKSVGLQQNRHHHQKAICSCHKMAHFARKFVLKFANKDVCEENQLNF